MPQPVPFGPFEFLWFMEDEAEPALLEQRGKDTSPDSWGTRHTWSAQDRSRSPEGLAAGIIWVGPRKRDSRKAQKVAGLRAGAEGVGGYQTFKAAGECQWPEMCFSHHGSCPGLGSVESSC